MHDVPLDTLEEVIEYYSDLICLLKLKLIWILL